MNLTFVGRREEIRRFKQTLKYFLDSPSNINENPIFIIHGSVGMGKTSLLEKLYEQSQEQPFKDCFEILKLDWGKQVEHDLINSTMVLKIIYEALINNEQRKEYFSNFARALEILRSAKDKYEEAEEQQELTDEFVEPELEEDEKDIYQKPEDFLAQALAEGINNLSQNKPLLVFFDTYELIGQIDAEQAIREVIKKSDNQVIWVIAGRNDLTK
ncbi:MAG: ATP-binding protein, partial [Okeania sp. SIO3B3]|nr:ATP-binding protein [Okeania sp. SIO3B3]